MAKMTEFIDEAGRRAWKNEQGMVYTENATNPTNYNVSQWNTRQRERWGKGGEGGSAGSLSSFDLNKMYESAMGGEDIKSIESELESKKAALNRARSNINDNPFYSEATRVGRIAKLEEAANRDIANVETALARKQADIQTRLNIATQQYNIQSQEYQRNLSNLNTLISTGAITGLSGSDLASLSASTGLSSGMIQAMQNAAKQKQAGQSEPTLIQTVNKDTGEVNLSVFDVKNNRLLGTTNLGPLAGTGAGGASISGADRIWDEITRGVPQYSEETATATAQPYGPAYPVQGTSIAGLW